jgi:hypothetical protein
MPQWEQEKAIMGSLQIGQGRYDGPNATHHRMSSGAGKKVIGAARVLAAASALKTGAEKR